MFIKADPSSADSKVYALLLGLKFLGFLQKIIQIYISTASKNISKELLAYFPQDPAFLIIPYSLDSYQELSVPTAHLKSCLEEEKKWERRGRKNEARKALGATALTPFLCHERKLVS